ILFCTFIRCHQQFRDVQTIREILSRPNASQKRLYHISVFRFITCGMGGGTGTGAAPIVAEIAKDLGALTVGIVTKPFLFEGGRRQEKADQGIKDLRDYVDTLIVVPNQKLISLVPKNTPLEQAFRVADEVLLHATKGISDLINVPGLINLDFADVNTVMCNMGDALMGTGVATGESRAKDAAEQAIHSNMIDDICIKGALGVLVNITGGKDLSINDINEATSVVFTEAGSDANIIFGAVIDPELEEELRVTVIATGFHRDGMRSSFFDETRKKAASVPREGLHDMPIFQKMESETLEQTVGNIFGNDGGLTFSSKEDLNIPTFIRKQMD
ncbi:cell division protein FtsZ, partial [bacterium I07]